MTRLNTTDCNALIQKASAACPTVFMADHPVRPSANALITVSSLRSAGVHIAAASS